MFFRAHTHLGRSKYLLDIYKLFGANQELVVKASTQLVIEGAARTATTFAYYGMLSSQSRSLSIAYHIHLPGQVFRALKLNIPVLVTMRNPRDAVASAIVREPYMPTKAYLERYFHFYQTLKPHIDQFLVADFDEVVNNFPTIIDRLNCRYGLDFCAPTNLPRFTAEVTKYPNCHHQSYGGGVHQSYLPNAAKNSAKNQVDFRAHKELLTCCEGLYEHYLSRMAD
jgi:hypothetical protein